MDLAQYARALFFRTLQSIDVGAAVRGALVRRGNELQVAGRVLRVAEFDAVVVVALGKASVAMAHAALPLLEGLPVRGLVVSGGGVEAQDARLRYMVGGHPIPDAGSRAAAEAALELLRSATERTLVLFLISGGASAMMELPLDASITVEETAAFYQALVHSGLAITEMNCVRKHFSAVKGGRLAEAAGAAAMQVTLVVSDVPRDQLDVVASGPSLADGSTVEQCRHILEEAGLLAQVPRCVARLLGSAALAETVKRGAACLARSEVVCVLSEADLLRRAAELAEADGFAVTVDMRCDDWPVEEAASYLLARSGELAKGPGRYCLLSGGEISVPLPERVGTGGRNQQFALTCARMLHATGEEVTVLSAGSDGLDGNSPAAGAVVDQRTWGEAGKRGLDAEASFRGFDSFALLDALGATLVSGPTGNNLRDIRMVLRAV